MKKVVKLLVISVFVVLVLLTILGGYFYVREITVNVEHVHNPLIVTPDAVPEETTNKRDSEYVDISNKSTQNSNTSAFKGDYTSGSQEAAQEVYTALAQVAPNTLNRFPAFCVDAKLPTHHFEEILHNGLRKVKGRVIRYSYGGDFYTEKFDKESSFDCEYYELYCSDRDYDDSVPDEEKTASYTVFGDEGQLCPFPMKYVPIRYMDIGGSIGLEGGIVRQTQPESVILVYGEGEYNEVNGAKALTYYVDGGGSVYIEWDVNSSNISVVRYTAPESK